MKRLWVSVIPYNKQLAIAALESGALGLLDWGLVIVISSLPLWGTEIYKAIRR